MTTFPRNVTFDSDIEHTSEEDILEGIKHFPKSLIYWGYVLHDKDTYTSDEVEEMKKKGKEKIPEVGNLKKPHWHVTLEFNRGTSIPNIAKAFKVPEHMICIIRNGKQGRLSILKYLTHSSKDAIAKGKHRYSSEEVHCNFDYEKRIEELELECSSNSSKNENSPKKRMDSYSVPILNGEMTPEQIRKQDAEVYAKYYKEIKGIYAEYLKTVQPPESRTCVFITGEGGVGKDSLAKALAHALYMDLSEDKCIYPAGSSECAFDNYEQEKAILWSELRADTFLQYFGGRGNVFNLFDAHPRHQAFNVKYSNVYLNHEVGFITTQDSYESFLDAMTKGANNSSGKEDAKQVYRRFPIWITAEKRRIIVNYSCGAVDKSRPYDEVDSFEVELATDALAEFKKYMPEDYEERICKECLKPVVDKIKECLQVRIDLDNLSKLMALCKGVVVPDIPEEFKQEQLTLDTSISSERRKNNA